jgi:hypothetical protein
MTTSGTDLSGNLLTTGGTNTTIERGFIISSTNNIPLALPSTFAQTMTNGAIRVSVDTNTSAGSFTKAINTLQGLNANTLYYVRAYAYNTAYNFTNCNAFAYSSNEMSFTSAPAAPGITTDGSQTITNNSATLLGTLGNLNGGTLTENGFIYTTTSGTGYNPSGISTNTENLGKITSTDNTTQFTETTPTILGSGKQYYFKAYAISSVGTSFGLEKSFITLAKIETTLTSTAVEITPNILTTSDLAITNRGIIWNNTNSGLTTNISTLSGVRGKTIDTSATTTSATSLYPNTKYYVVGYVTNTTGTYYETVKEQLTLPAFIITTINKTVTSTSEGVSVAITNSGNVIMGSAQIDEKGIVYSTSIQSPTVLDTKVSSTAVTGLGLGAYTTNVTGLQSGTKYYYRLYAKNSAGYGYYNDENFTTLAIVNLPSIVPSIVYDSGAKTLTITGVSITNDGNEQILEYGLCHTTSTQIPTVGHVKVIVGTNTTTTTSFNATISNIATGTTYKIRAYVQNAGGYGYSSILTLVTNSTGVGTLS